MEESKLMKVSFKSFQFPPYRGGGGNLLVWFRKVSKETTGKQLVLLLKGRKSFQGSFQGNRKNENEKSFLKISSKKRGLKDGENTKTENQKVGAYSGIPRWKAERPDFRTVRTEEIDRHKKGTAWQNVSE